MRKNAYYEGYVSDAQDNLADFFDCGKYGYSYAPDRFMEQFIKSGIAHHFETGHPKYVTGMSGFELAREVIHSEIGEYKITNYRGEFFKSPEYWAGWSLAYYQWLSGMSFAQIQKAVPISDIVEMYHPLHEAGLEKFADVMDIRISQDRSS
jgi:hypothetical protein